MGFCQGFGYDLFLSYSRLNNAAAGLDDRGWVTDLHEVLRKKLAERLYIEPAIWRDEGGLDGKVIDDGIGQALQNSAVFLAVCSGAFLASKYCVPIELAGFRHPKFDLVVRGSSRIVVAAYDGQRDIPRATWPEGLRDVPCVDFRQELDDGSSRLFTRPRLSDPEEPYWHSIEKLVRHIVATLRELQRGTSGAEVATAAPPLVSQPQPAAAWQRRFRKPLVHITYQSENKGDADRLADQLRATCDVTLLSDSQGDAKRQQTYIANSDGHILLFPCSRVEWAEDKALYSLTVRTEHGRPRRLGLSTDGLCAADFAIRSDFVVPIVSGRATVDEFVSSLLETS